MLLTLIKREIVGNVLSFRFIVTFLLFFSVILISVFVLTNTYLEKQSSYEVSRTAHHAALSKLKGLEDVEKQTEELFINQGVYADLAPQYLGVFVDGLESSLPSQLHTAAFNSRKIDEDMYQNPLYALFSTPDYGYVVNVVVSLLALLFVFDAICGEKERSTLKITLANAVPRDLLILGKWIGGYVSLAVPFLVALLAGVIYVMMTGAIVLSGEVLHRFIWIVVISLLYISLFFTLGLMISTLTHRASTALIVSLFVWICWILVIPNLAPVIARIAYPVPSSMKIAAEKQAIDQETEFRINRVSQTMLSYGKKAEEVRDEIRADGVRSKKKLDRFFRSEFQTQIDLSKTLSRLSPAASFRYASTEMAETGISHFDGFKDAYVRFQEEFSEYAEEVFDKQNDDNLADDWLQIDQIPTLKAFDARLDDTIDIITVDIGLLVLYNILFFMGSYLFFIRYDVT